MSGAGGVVPDRQKTLQKQLDHKHNRTACHRHLKQTCTKPCCKDTDDECNGTGYKGRVAIHEMVVINKALRRMIAEGASIEEMTDAARKTQGMRSLRESAVQLVRDGVTTPEELLKITYFEE